MVPDSKEEALVLDQILDLSVENYHKLNFIIDSAKRYPDFAVYYSCNRMYFCREKHFKII